METLEYKLSLTLNIPYKKKYNSPDKIPKQFSSLFLTAKRHQNIIGWNYFLKGFISSFWIELQYLLRSPTGPRVPNMNTWETKITSLTINLLKDIWADRNTYIHGKSTEEARANARAAIIRQISVLYKTPPVLAKRYACITEIPFETRIRKTTTQLQQWMDRVKHQIKMSQYLCNPRFPGQLTLHQAYRRAGIELPEGDGGLKYPP